MGFFRKICGILFKSKQFLTESEFGSSELRKNINLIEIFVSTTKVSLIPRRND